MWAQPLPSRSSQTGKEGDTDPPDMGTQLFWVWPETLHFWPAPGGVDAAGLRSLCEPGGPHTVPLGARRAWGNAGGRVVRDAPGN